MVGVGWRWTLEWISVSPSGWSFLTGVGGNSGILLDGCGSGTVRADAGIDQSHGTESIFHGGDQSFIIPVSVTLEIGHDSDEGIGKPSAIERNWSPIQSLTDDFQGFRFTFGIIQKQPETHLSCTAITLDSDGRLLMPGTMGIGVVEGETTTHGSIVGEDDRITGILEIGKTWVRDRVAVGPGRLSE